LTRSPPQNFEVGEALNRAAAAPAAAPPVAPPLSLSAQQQLEKLAQQASLAQQQQAPQQPAPQQPAQQQQAQQQQAQQQQASPSPIVEEVMDAMLSAVQGFLSSPEFTSAHKQAMLQDRPPSPCV